MGKISLFFDRIGVDFIGISQDKFPEESHLISDVGDIFESISHGMNNWQFEFILFDGGNKPSINTLNFFFNRLLYVGWLHCEMIPEIIQNFWLYLDTYLIIFEDPQEV